MHSTDLKWSDISFQYQNCPLYSAYKKTIGKKKKKWWKNDSLKGQELSLKKKKKLITNLMVSCFITY